MRYGETMCQLCFLKPGPQNTKSALRANIPWKFSVLQFLSWTKMHIWHTKVSVKSCSKDTYLSLFNIVCFVITYWYLRNVQYALWSADLNYKSSLNILGVGYFVIFLMKTETELWDRTQFPYSHILIQIMKTPGIYRGIYIFKILTVISSGKFSWSIRSYPRCETRNPHATARSLIASITHT